ncbi:hypothetical protein ORI20_23915 [Mycobacterium sp. CVI_P3]|uniref:Uncharacterized protein n=1 Tax=Mycobacterium pinniadriaticum TaxID=2994102 RepID=A0ABT3SJR8_9MYCO|nr:hypothetical protein [Mycobacterium pinniadriaticum]MCX2933324.1 hypothetical protein [Mycobacterium pinniadriaticum]MCX2939746.1 hypothetical protein [Mycobacterium pinniadriaticum]
MNGPHPDLGPELRALAQAILDRLDPAVRAGAAMTAGAAPGKCQQVWCPVCALAALVNGEQHPLLTVVAEHSVALVTMIRAMVAEEGGGEPEPPGESPDGPAPDSPGPPSSRYQHIPVSVEE